MFCQRRTDAPLTQEEEQRKWETRIRWLTAEQETGRSQH
jgi:hypothetical protein